MNKLQILLVPSMGAHTSSLEPCRHDNDDTKGRTGGGGGGVKGRCSEGKDGKV